MGVNWNGMNNPETIPFKGYVPKIALPTVFGDALSYLEDVSKVNYAINKTIEEVNNLAQNLIEVVSQSIESAKIPVYDELVHNGSNIVSPLNWNLSNPETIFKAIGAGKMCILTADCDFNIDHIPVPSNRTKQAFVLTQAYQINPNNNTTTVNAVFVNYNSNRIRYVEVSILRDNNVYTSTILNFTEYEIPTTQMIQDMHQFIDKKVMVYIGQVDIPSENESYIEITNNASSIDLKSYFMVESADAHLYAPTTCPCVVVDYRSGVIGLFKYGGDVTPWARIYGTGYRLNSDFNDQLADLYDYVDEYDTHVGELDTRMTTAEGDIQGLKDRVESTETSIANLDGEVVKTTPQDLTESQKIAARSNIDSAQAHNPLLYGKISVIDDYGNSAFLSLDVTGNVKYLLFEGGAPIIRGVRDPVAAQDVATKGYVDNAIPEVTDAVKYTYQVLTDTQAQTARNNIKACEKENPYMLGNLTIQDNDAVITLSVAISSGNRTIIFTGSGSDVILRRVGAPVYSNDAANKAYVDAMVVQTEGNVKYDRSQSLSQSEKEQARQNIDAASDYDAVIGSSLRIDAGRGNSPTIIMDNGSDQRRIVLTDNNELMVTDGNGFLQSLKVKMARQIDEVVPLEQVLHIHSPYIININSSENAWTCTRDNASVQNYDEIVNGFYGGVPVIIVYRTVGTYGVSYAQPKWVSLDYGIRCEGYTGVANKIYTINSDGTVTTTTL